MAFEEKIDLRHRFIKLVMEWLSCFDKWQNGAQLSTLPCSSAAPTTNTSISNMCEKNQQAVNPRMLIHTANSNSSACSLLAVETYCGTIIELQGSHGSLIPHFLDQDKLNAFHSGSCSKNIDSKSAIPWIVPFTLANTDQNLLEHDLVVGSTVEFSILREQQNSRKLVAHNIKPVRSNAEVQREILKTRHALSSCKQARQESFVKAMEELTTIPPRNEPIIDHVDLIQYAANLDAQE